MKNFARDEQLLDQHEAWRALSSFANDQRKGSGYPRLASAGNALVHSVSMNFLSAWFPSQGSTSLERKARLAAAYRGTEDQVVRLAAGRLQMLDLCLFAIRTLGLVPVRFARRPQTGPASR